MITLGMVRHQERHVVVDCRGSSHHKENDIDTALFNKGITMILTKKKKHNSAVPEFTKKK